MRTFSSIYAFNASRFGLRRATCVTNSAEGGGGGIISPRDLGDSILTSICNKLVDKNLSVDINGICDDDMLVETLDEMAKKHSEDEVNNALKLLESEGMVQLQSDLGCPNPPLSKITDAGFRRYVQTCQMGHPDFPFAKKVGESILALNEQSPTVEDVRGKCPNLPHLLIEYGLSELKQRGAIRILDGGISQDGGERMISYEKVVLGTCLADM